MNKEQMPLYAAALAVLAVVLVFAGVSVETLLVTGVVLVCPVMMFFMMRGMGRRDSASHDGQDKHSHD